MLGIASDFPWTIWSRCLCSWTCFLAFMCDFTAHGWWLKCPRISSKDGNTPCYCWSCHGLANAGTPAHAANDRWRRTYPLLRLYGCLRPRRLLIQFTVLDKTRLISIWIVHTLPEVIRWTSDMRKAGVNGAAYRRKNTSLVPPPSD